MDRTPPEAQELMKQFHAEQAAQMAKSANAKTAREAARKEASKAPQETKRRVMKTDEAERRANECGCRIEGGGGKHGKHIVAPNGKRISLPDHGGGHDLSTGVTKKLEEFFRNNGGQKP